MDFEIYTETGGARIGMWNASWPFATLTVSIDRLTLDCFGNSYSFSKEQISSITKFRGLFSLGIQINSDSEKMPIPLVFWSLRFACLRKNLEMRGFSID